MRSAIAISSLLHKIFDDVLYQIVGSSFHDHDVKGIADELQKWWPRLDEYKQFISWNAESPKSYTRNLVFGNEHFQCILMCWPPSSVSSIHCHDKSSCWVALVAGEVFEVGVVLDQH